MARTIIKGGTVVTEADVFDADVIIEGERIAGVMAEITPADTDTVINAEGLLVMPGIVDAHTHIQLDTGIYQTADNWHVGTQAAAAGGVTTVIDFATQFPGQTVDEALDARFEETKPALIDYGLHCMITELPRGTEDAMLGRLIERGVMSFKVYTTYRPNYFMDDATLLRLLEAAANVNGLVIAHAENDQIVTDATERLVEQDKTGWKYHAKARPASAEWEAVNRLMYLAELTGASIYIVHCTSGETIRLIVSARRRGVDAFCETCPQYLLLDGSVYDGPQPEHYILQPPLRDSSENEALWWELCTPDSPISVVSTDSCDYTIAQKREFSEFTKTPGGLPGVETLLPLMYTYGVASKEYPFRLMDLVRKLSANPARIYGRYPQKGALLPGSDADIVLYDPAPEKELQHGDLHYLAGYSPYEGMSIKGEVRMTISRGDVIYDSGEIIGKAGRGKFVPGVTFDSTNVNL